jgi:hypothetical protein
MWRSRYVHLEVARMLIERGADVSAQHNGHTTLHLALTAGIVEVARMLSSAARCVSPGQIWQDPITYGVSWGSHFRSSRSRSHAYRARDADVSAQDKDGQTFHYIWRREWGDWKSLAC